MAPKDIVSQLRGIADDITVTNNDRFLSLHNDEDLIVALEREIDPTYYQINNVVGALRDLAYDIDDAAWRAERDRTEEMKTSDIVSQLRHIANELAMTNDGRFILGDWDKLITEHEADAAYYQINDIIDAMRQLAKDIEEEK